MKADLQRVVVVGTSCSGKTTFARRLSQALDLPHVELDAIHWLKGWVPRPREEFRELVGQAAARPAWVMDGNYGTVRDPIWPRATTAVWLNYPFRTVMWRALKRTVRRSVTAEELYAGNRETISQAFFSRDSILWWVVTSHHRLNGEYRGVFDGDGYPHLTRIEFKNAHECAQSLRSIAADRWAK